MFITYFIVTNYRYGRRHCCTIPFLLEHHA